MGRVFAGDGLGGQGAVGRFVPGSGGGCVRCVILFGDGDLMELVMSFNELPGVSRCVFDGEDVYVLITYPLHPGMAVEDFVFALEDEMMLVASSWRIWV